MKRLPIAPPDQTGQILPKEETEEEIPSAPVEAEAVEEEVAEEEVAEEEEAEVEEALPS
jgi:hypothetical protein